MGSVLLDSIELVVLVPIQDHVLVVVRVVQGFTRLTCVLGCLILIAGRVCLVLMGNLPRAVVGIHKVFVIAVLVAITAYSDLGAAGSIQGCVNIAQLALLGRTIFIVFMWIQGLVSVVLRVVLEHTDLDA